MAVRSGIATQLGAKAESTWGTAVTVDVFIPIVSDGLGVDRPRVESAGILTGRHLLTSEQWAGGNKTVGGDLGLELPTNSAIARLLLEHMFGTVAGTGPYTYTPSDLYGKGLTLQVGVPGVDGTVRTKTYEGAKFNTWELGWNNAADPVTLGLGVIAEDESVATALASASYASGAATPFYSVGATATIGGSTVQIKQGTLAADHKLARRFFAGSNLTAEPIHTELREITGNLQLEFVDLTQYNRFLGGTEAAVVLTFSGTGSSSLVITMNCRFDGESPKVPSREIVDQPLPIKVIASTTDASGITAVYTAPS